MFTKMLVLLACCSVPLISAAQSSTVQNVAASRQAFVARPHFRGDLNTYITKNLKYPDQAREKCIQGKCVVEFMVDESGKVARVAPIQSSGNKLLDAEAERVIAAMPDWRIAANTQPGRHFYSLPINFELD